MYVYKEVLNYREKFVFFILFIFVSIVVVCCSFEVFVVMESFSFLRLNEEVLVG